MGENLTIENTAENFETWTSQEFVSNETRPKLLKAGILFVPNIGYREEKGPVFPALTEDIVSYLREHLPKDIALELCVDSDKYKELALYSDHKRLGNFIVTALLFPTFVGVLSSYIYDKYVKADEQKPATVTVVKNIDNSVHNTYINESPKKYQSPTKVMFTITVVDSNGTSKKITYEGNAKDVEQTVKAIKLLQTNDTK